MVENSLEKTLKINKMIQFYNSVEKYDMVRQLQSMLDQIHFDEQEKMMIERAKENNNLIVIDTDINSEWYKNRIRKK